MSGRPFAHVNWIDPHAVATGEMVFRLAREAGRRSLRRLRPAFYTALMTDTGSFMFQGTNEHTFALARELVLAGADPSHCARSIYFAHSVAKMRLLGEALRNLNTEGPHRLDLGDAGTNGALRSQRGRLRRSGELRSFHRRSRGGGILSRTPRRTFSRKPAQQGSSSMWREWPRVSAVVATSAPAVARSMVHSPKRCATDSGTVCAAAFLAITYKLVFPNCNC